MRGKEKDSEGMEKKSEMIRKKRRNGVTRRRVKGR